MPRAYPGQVGKGFSDDAGGGGQQPNAPVLSVTISGTTATATITGDVGASHYLYYRPSTATEWTDGGNRSGDGTLEVSDLSTGVQYIFEAQSKSASDVWGRTSNPIIISIAAAFDAAFADALIDAADAFLETFGESVTYLPAAGGQRAIKAIIDRNGLQQIPGGISANAPAFIVSVKNDADEGISTTEINTGGDKIRLSSRIAGDTTDRRIIHIIAQDAAELKLGVG